MMTKILVALFVIFPAFLKAQELSFAWATASQTNDLFNIGTGYDCEIDEEENVFSAGSFSGELDFDPSSANYLVSSIGSNDCYIQKQNASGDLLWVKTFGSNNGSAMAHSIDLDSQGNLIIVGTFNNVLDIDPGPNVFLLNGSGLYTEGFVLKLNSDGDFIWARMIEGQQTASCISVAVDNSDNIVVSGFFNTTANFDPGASNFSLTSNGYNDSFVLKVDSDGNFLWAVSIEGQDQNKSLEVATAQNNTIYLTGYFYMTADFDPGAGSYPLTAGNNLYNHDAYILKLSEDGVFVWAKQIGGGALTGAGGKSLTVDSQENIVIVGGFDGSVDFDPGAGQYIMTATSSLINNGFVLKLNPDGEFIFAKQLDCDYLVELTQVKTDENNQIYISGQHMGIIDFNPDSQIQDTYESIGFRDAFNLKLSDQGEFEWYKVIAGEDSDENYGLSVNPQGTILYSTGNIRATADFNPDEGTYLLDAMGNPLPFVLKLAQELNPDPVPPEPPIEDEQGLIVFPNVITANHDGINDGFVPVSIASDITVKQIVVLNRWGNQVYSSDSFIAPWSGECNGNSCAEGVYFWIVTYVNSSNEVIEAHGSITLTR